MMNNICEYDKKYTNDLGKNKTGAEPNTLEWTVWSKFLTSFKTFLQKRAMSYIWFMCLVIIISDLTQILLTDADSLELNSLCILKLFDWKVRLMVTRSCCLVKCVITDLV